MKTSPSRVETSPLNKSQTPKETLMDKKTFETAAGSPNILSVPRQARDYISEQGKGRSFNLDSFSIDRSSDPHQVLIHLGVAQRGAEQLVPFTVSLGLGEPAAQQLTDSLIAALSR